MSKTKKSSRSLSSKVKKFSRAGLAVLSSIPTPGWGSASKKALAVSVSRSKVKKTSTKNKNQTNKKTSKRLSSLKNLLKRLSQKSRYGRMYTNARKLSSEWKLKDRIQKLKTMMFPTAVFVPKRPTNEDEMLAAAYKNIYKQLRKNGELPDFTVGYEIDPQTGDYYSDFYSKRRVLGNPSSNLKPYSGGHLTTIALNYLTEDYQPLVDDQASFGKKLEAKIYLVVRPAQAIGRVIKGVKRVTGNGYKYWNKTTEFKNVKVYQRNDIIDPNMKDAMGRTNLERMKKGLAPLGPDGKSINLHHTTQRNTSPIAEVTQTFHKENSKVIHINPNTIPSGINRTEFNRWRTDYWKNRANDF